MDDVKQILVVTASSYLMINAVLREEHQATIAITTKIHVLILNGAPRTVKDFVLLTYL